MTIPELTVIECNLFVYQCITASFVLLSIILILVLGLQGCFSLCLVCELAYNQQWFLFWHEDRATLLCKGRNRFLRRERHIHKFHTPVYHLCLIDQLFVISLLLDRGEDVLNMIWDKFIYVIDVELVAISLLPHCWVVLSMIAWPLKIKLISCIIMLDEFIVMCVSSAESDSAICTQIIVAPMGNDQLLKQLDTNLWLFQLMVHKLLCNCFRHILVVQFLYDEIREVYAFSIYKILFENIVFELPTA